MSKEPAIIEAVYTEWKMVKTRSALVLCFEVPLEHQAYVQGALGTPLPDQSIHVAIARLMPGAKPLVHAVEPPGRSGSLAQGAGILCNEGGFQTFMREAKGYHHVETAEAVRLWCGVDSRAQLDKDETAGSIFRDLRDEYRLWLRDEVPA